MSPPSQESSHDLSKHFPADFTAWRDRPYVTLREAVLLSLSIDPETLAEAQALDAHSSSDVYDNPETVELEPLYYHAQHEEYTRRHKAAQHACRHGSLASDTETSVDTVRLAEFVRWAGERGWQLPRQFVGLAALPEQNRGLSNDAPPGSSVLRDETREKREAMRRVAIGIVHERPRRADNKTRVASKVAMKMKEQNPEWDLSESYVRNTLFYADNCLIPESEWRQIKAEAWENVRPSGRQKN